MYLILGSNEIFTPCKLNTDFRDVILYNNSKSFSVDYIARLSTGKLEPVFLSKMNDEPSYNKYYENLIKNEIGPIKNGLSSQSNALNTSISSQKNIY